MKRMFITAVCCRIWWPAWPAVRRLAPAQAAATRSRSASQGPMTGDYAYEGKGFKKAVQLLVDQTNAAGGINGKKVELHRRRRQG